MHRQQMLPEVHLFRTAPHRAQLRTGSVPKFMSSFFLHAEGLAGVLAA
jgi:hypothetical protein